MYASAYGAIPVARTTGGLTDFIVPFNQKAKKGNGFAFENYTASELIKAIDEAIGVYHNKELWMKLSDSTMKSDTSWAKHVPKYDEIYRSLFKD